MEPVLAATPYVLVTPAFDGRVGVVRPIAGLLTGDLAVGVMGVTTFVPEKEKEEEEEDVEGVKATGEEMTGVGVMGVVMGRAEEEESVGEGTMGVGVMVEVTCVMGLVGEWWIDCEELAREGEVRLLLLRLWLLWEWSGVVGVSGEEMEMGLEDGGYWMKEPDGGLFTGVKAVLLNVKLLFDVAVKLFKKLKLLLLLLNTLLFVFAIAAFARALAVREEGLKVAPASAEVRVLLGRGVVGMMGVMWVEVGAPERLLKL